MSDFDKELVVITVGLAFLWWASRTIPRTAKKIARTAKETAKKSGFASETEVMQEVARRINARQGDLIPDRVFVTEGNTTYAIDKPTLSNVSYDVRRRLIRGEPISSIVEREQFIDSIRSFSGSVVKTLFSPVTYFVNSISDTKRRVLS